MFVLPIAAYLLFCAAYFDQKKNVVESVAVSWLFLTLFTWLFTEVSGAFGLFGTPAALAAWGALCLALAVYLIRKGLPRRAAVYFRTDGHMRGFWRENRANVICMAVFCTVVCLLAVLRSQNLIDNLEHRLPKIMHWIQNGRPGYFATETPQEINYTKLIEYMNAQIILLFGPDRVVNLVQIGAYLCSACCIYGISRKLRASRSFAFLACWIYLLNPMIMIEVFTAQTDVAAGVYLLAFVYFLLDFIHADRLRMDRRGALEAVGLALSAMFGYLSKPTVCFAMVIFFLWMCAVRIVRRDSLKALAQFAVAGGLIAVILLVPDAVRKYEYQRIPNVIPESVETEESTDGAEEEETEAGALADEYALSDGVVNTLRQPKEYPESGGKLHNPLFCQSKRMDHPVCGKVRAYVELFRRLPVFPGDGRRRCGRDQRAKPCDHVLSAGRMDCCDLQSQQDRQRAVSLHAVSHAGNGRAGWADVLHLVQTAVSDWSYGGAVPGLRGGGGEYSRHAADETESGGGHDRGVLFRTGEYAV